MANLVPTIPELLLSGRHALYPFRVVTPLHAFWYFYFFRTSPCCIPSFFCTFQGLLLTASFLNSFFFYLLLSRRIYLLFLLLLFLPSFAASVAAPLFTSPSLAPFHT